MNLFKRATATIALVTLVSGIFSTGAYASSSTEIEAANALAVKQIINDHSSDTAAYNLNQNVLRQEIAAVARGVAGLEKKATCDNKFSDVSATKPNTWACFSVEALLDAGLVAANPTFRPEAQITKAEAVGMMVKAAFGNEYAFDSTLGTSWMEQVVAFAVSKGVVASFTNYDTPATRGFVFEAGNNAILASEEVVDTCDEVSQLLGLCDDTTNNNTGTGSTGTGTGSTGTGVVVTGGDVELSLNPDSAANGTQVPNVGTIRFAKVDLTAGTSDVSVNTIEVKSLGLSAVPTGTKVWFEKDGKRLSGKATFSSERVAITSFAPAFAIKAGETSTLELYAELNANSGVDLQLTGKIVNSSAANNLGSFTTNSLRTATYTVAPVEFNGVSSVGSSVSQTADALELARFTIENKDVDNETRDVDFQSITLKQLGNADLTSLSNIVLERNGKVVSTETIVDSKNLTFYVTDTIKDGGTKATYYVKAIVDTVENNAGDTYNFELKNTSDLSVVEVLNGFRSTVTKIAAFATYTVTGADVTFARDTSVELSKTYAKGSSDVVFLQGTITAKTPISLEDPKLTFNGTGSELFSTLYLQIGSTTMTWSATATGTAEFSGLATVNGTANVKLYAKLKDSANAVDVKFDDLKLSSFVGAKEYVSNQNTITSSVGAISGINVTVGTTLLSVNRTDGLGNTKVSVGSKGVLANEVSLTVTQGNSVNVSNATYLVAGSGAIANNVFATLFVDGVAVSSKTISATGSVTFSNLSKVVSTTAVKLAVKLDLSDTFAAGDINVQLTALDAIDNVTSVAVTPTYPTAATLTLAAAKGTVSSSDNNPKASLLLAGAKDQKVLAFRVKAENDSVKLRDVSFTGTALNNLSNFRILTPDNKNLVATSNNSTTVTFTNIADTDNYSVAMDTTATFYLIADVNTNVSGVTNLAVTLDSSVSKVKAANGILSNFIGGAVSSNVHAIDENMAVVAKVANSSKDLSTSALRFSVTATGKDSVTLTSATFDNVLSGYTGATNLSVYKTSVSGGNLVGTVAATTGIVTFSSNNTVDAGSTNNYIVVIDGTVDSNANTPSWTVRLTNLQVGAFAAASYLNMGDFPITETK